MSKTTKENLETFKDSVYQWQELLGLMDWEVYFAHRPLKGSYASCFWVMDGQVATITLNTVWDDLRDRTDGEIRKVALHEILHLLTAPFMAQAEARYTNQETIDVVEHAIVRRLEVLVERIYNGKTKI